MTGITAKEIKKALKEIPDNREIYAETNTGIRLFDVVIKAREPCKTRSIGTLKAILA